MARARRRGRRRRAATRQSVPTVKPGAQPGLVLSLSRASPRRRRTSSAASQGTGGLIVSSGRATRVPLLGAGRTLRLRPAPRSGNRRPGPAPGHPPTPRHRGQGRIPGRGSPRAPGTATGGLVVAPATQCLRRSHDSGTLPGQIAARDLRSCAGGIASESPQRGGGVGNGAAARQNASRPLPPDTGPGAPPGQETQALCIALRRHGPRGPAAAVRWLPRGWPPSQSAPTATVTVCFQVTSR